MARWHKLQHPETGEIAWTDHRESRADWVVLERANRRPGPHEDKVDGRWRTDEAALAKRARRAKLKAMHRDELVDHVVELVVEQVLERLKAEGFLKGKGPGDGGAA